MRAGQPAKLRDLGYDEVWLQNWLAADPARLGLGEVRIVAQELTAPRGGSLDILAADGDTYYSVEVQLGEVGAGRHCSVQCCWLIAWVVVVTCRLIAISDDGYADAQVFPTVRKCRTWNSSQTSTCV